MRNLGILIIIVTLMWSCNSTDKKSNTSSENLKDKKEQITKQLDSLTAELKLVDEQLSTQTENQDYQIVTVIKATSKNFKHFIEVYGSVKAEKNVEIRPEMSGIITHIFVKEGQHVSKGQVLIQLDASTVNTSIDELKTRLELATTAFERQERLWKQQIGSEMQFLQAKNQKESLEKSIKSLQVQAQKMRITAPFDGVIDYIFPKIGELASSQYPIIRLVNLNSLYLEADVTESHLVDVKKGTPVQIIFSSINKEMTSKITTVGNFINPENRSFKVRIDLPSNEKALKPNLFANININNFESDGIVLPLQVIQKDKEGKNYVYVAVTENNKTTVIKKIVTVRSTYNNEVLIGDELQENELVIDKGSRTVNEGNLISIKSE
ncbi:MAG: efflux RND transporter periplasmic adaptor subunit [Flavobacteriaceae bacterium]|nr:efflux RND transporter periplasmic adaptor subunit [Flavobacteriaceae bacterium]